MFYIPEPPNDEYSEGFRKLITRAIQRISRDNLEEQTKERLAHLDCHQSVLKRKREFALHNKRKSHFVKHCIDDEPGRENYKQVILPKVETPSQRFKIRGQLLSKKFINSSDKQIKSLLYHLNRQKTGKDQSLKNSISICVHPRKGQASGANRKIKSECSIQIPQIQERGEKRKKHKNASNFENEAIGPWKPGILSISGFHDCLAIDHCY